MTLTGPGTVNDDLERFIVKLRIGHVRALEGEVRTFQFPKLTEDELQLWENRDPNFLSSFQVQPEGAEPGEFHTHPIEFIRISGSRLTILKKTVTVSNTTTSRDPGTEMLVRADQTIRSGPDADQRTLLTRTFTSTRNVLTRNLFTRNTTPRNTAPSNTTTRNTTKRSCNLM